MECPYPRFEDSLSGRETHDTRFSGPIARVNRDLHSSQSQKNSSCDEDGPGMRCARSLGSTRNRRPSRKRRNGAEHSGLAQVDTTRFPFSSASWDHATVRRRAGELTSSILSRFLPRGTSACTTVPARYPSRAVPMGASTEIRSWAISASRGNASV